MLRVLIIVVVLGVVFALIAKGRRLVEQSRMEKKSPGKMVKCAECGVYLPEPEAHEGADGQFLCDIHGSSPGTGDTKG